MPSERNGTHALGMTDWLQMLDLDPNNFLINIKDKKKGDFTHQEELVVGLTCELVGHRSTLTPELTISYRYTDG